jgi:hypothetical protein
MGSRFRGCDRLTNQAISRYTAIKMVKRLAQEAGFGPELCTHSFRVTGITAYLRNGGTLEVAATTTSPSTRSSEFIVDRGRIMETVRRFC